MTTMLKRIARTLSWQDFRHTVQGEPLEEDEGWSGYHIDEKYFQRAKEVLEAMYEPIGIECIHNVVLSHRPAHCCVCHSSWNYMLDKILNKATGNQYST